MNKNPVIMVIGFFIMALAFERILKNNCQIDTRYVFSDAEHPSSGVALITVDAQAENCIVIVLMQLEVLMETIEYVATMAQVKGKMVILNPVPAQPLSKELLQHVGIHYI